MSQTRTSRDYGTFVAAGDTVTLHAAGEFISHRGGNTVEIRTHNGDSLTLAEGQGVRLEAFERLEITNPAGTDATATLFIGFGEYYGDAVAGTVAIAPAAGLATAADHAHAGGGVELVAAANAARKSITIGNLVANAPEKIRIGDANTGAARGYEIAPGQGFTFETTAAVYVYAANPVDLSIVEVLQ